MQMVIEIDSYVVEHCKRHVKEHYANVIEEVIANGIPLPKGHGRLIDADKYRKDMQDSREFNFFATLDFQPTIIEADREVRN